jgi:hypothetical protein
MNIEIFLLELENLQYHQAMAEKLQKSSMEHAHEVFTPYIGKKVEVKYLHNDETCTVQGKFITILKLSPCLSIETDDGHYYSPSIYNLVSFKEVKRKK